MSDEQPQPEAAAPKAAATPAQPETAAPEAVATPAPPEAAAPEAAATPAPPEAAAPEAAATPAPPEAAAPEAAATPAPPEAAAPEAAATPAPPEAAAPEAVATPAPPEAAAPEAAAPAPPAVSSTETIREEEKKELEEEKSRAEFGATLNEFGGATTAVDPEAGTKVKGRFIQIGEETSFVDFGGRSEGSIETQALKNADGEVSYAVGDEIELYVISTEDQITLGTSYTLQSDAAVSQLIDAKAKGIPISGKVASLNSGGVAVTIGTLSGFCPFSQIELGFCQDPSIHLGKTLEFLVQEVADKGRNIVLSRKALLRRAEKGKAEELLKTLAVGQMLDGTVSRIQPFGAFVNIGGVDGLVHVSEIAHARINHPNDVLKEGQSVRVKVLSIEDADKKKRRISLSIKAGEADPWEEIKEQYWEGKKTAGTVVRMQPFGAFVELTPGIDGLVHVSEIARRQVREPKDVLEIGQRVDVAVLKVDTEKKRISLSIKELLPVEEGAPSGEPSRPRRQEASKLPKVGEIGDGVVRNIKDFGIFVDLPKFGHRVSGLVPQSETGQPRGSDLAKHFKIGETVKVVVTNIGDDRKIRLSMTAVQDHEDRKSFESFKQSSSNKPTSTGMADAFRRAMDRSN